MVDIADQFHYIFRDREIARMSYSHVSDNYNLYDIFGIEIGEVQGEEIEEVKQFFKYDKVPYVDVRDCFNTETEEEMELYFKKVRDFCDFGNIDPTVDISYIDKQKEINMPQVTGGPASLNSLLEQVYASCMAKNKNEAMCSKESWGAARNAGWRKNKDGKWTKKSQEEIDAELMKIAGIKPRIKKGEAE